MGRITNIVKNIFLFLVAGWYLSLINIIAAIKNSLFPSEIRFPFEKNIQLTRMEMEDQISKQRSETIKTALNPVSEVIKTELKPVSEIENQKLLDNYIEWFENHNDLYDISSSGKHVSISHERSNFRDNKDNFRVIKSVKWDHIDERLYFGVDCKLVSYQTNPNRLKIETKQPLNMEHQLTKMKDQLNIKTSENRVLIKKLLPNNVFYSKTIFLSRINKRSVMKTITISLLWSWIFYGKSLYECEKDSAIIHGGFNSNEYPETEWEQTGVLKNYHGLNVVPTWGAYIVPQDAKIGELFYVEHILEDSNAGGLLGKNLMQDGIARWNGTDIEIDNNIWKDYYTMVG